MTKKLRTKYNDYDISDLPIVYYQDVRMMSEVDVNSTAELIRLKLLEKWEKNRQPLGGGKKSDDQIIKDFRSLMEFPDEQTLITDSDGNPNVIKFFGKQPSGINQYFPEMLDTPISLGNKSSSVMDVIKNTEVFRNFFHSIVYKDRMYAFTQWFGWTDENVGKPIEDVIPDETMKLLGNKVPYKFSNVTAKNINSRYDGYKLPFYFKDGDKYYKLDRENNDFKEGLRNGFKAVYVEATQKEYESNMKLFPNITQSFRLGGGSQPVSNFSAGVARFLIRKGFKNALEENIIEKDTFVVLDPSTGWAGRMVGLLSVHTQLRNYYREKTGRELTIIYLTTDPNEEIKDRYQDILDDWFTVIEPKADSKYFYMFKALYGSETKEFLHYCKTRLLEFGLNGVTMGLTSPPYFNRERYSEDENQSWVKYGNSYESWSKGFLRPTISNISELLLKDGIFYMNIANINHNGKNLPLEEDTKLYADEFSCSCNDDVYKMLMSTMTGNNKDSKGTGGQAKNSVRIKEGLRKFEPIFILVGGQKNITIQKPLQVPEGMFQGSKPMTGEELRILNQTSKRLISDEPTSLRDFYPESGPNDHPDTGFPEKMTEEEEKLSEEIIETGNNKFEFELPIKEQLTNTIEQLAENIGKIEQNFVTKVEKVVDTFEKKVEKVIDDADDWFDKL